MGFEHLYVHIPFCVSKCDYCDFVSYPASQQEHALAGYGGLLQNELALWGQQAVLGPWKTIYIGGGTPSLLPGKDIAGLLHTLLASKDAIAEITLEANPESISGEKLQQWLQAGVNRLSIGAQSFDDTALLAMGRPHTARQMLEALRQARQTGFANISVDLIYGLPGQTITTWQQQLQQALELEVEHISLYGLSLSEDSPWGREAAAGRLTLPTEDDSADMLEAAIRLLPAAGYNQYEISNFAKPGYKSRHNCAYWRRDNYLGLGAAAASCAGERRWFNERDLSAYANALAAGRLPVIEEENLSIEEVLGEAMFLGLRLTEGIDVADFAARYGISPEKYYKKPLAKLYKAGLLELKDGRLHLTKKGILLGNEVFMQFA